MLGSDRAPVVVIEVASFKCSHCRAFHEQVFPRLREKYIETGLVQWVILNAADDPSEEFTPVFPIARCALREGRYWDMLDVLFQAGGRSPSLQSDLVAKHRPMDRAELESCRRDRAVRLEVAADFAEYRTLQVRGTPTFLLRKLGSDGSRTTATIAGSQSLEHFQHVLEELLKAP